MGCGCGMLGVIGILLVFLMMGIFYAHAKHNPSWNQHDFALCQEHMKYLREALASYKRDTGHLPVQLKELQPRYIYSPEVLHCPLERTAGGAPYRYNPNAKNPMEALIICDNHGQATIMLQVNERLRFHSKLFDNKQKK